MKTRLLLARHGNTFRPGETPRRIGARTDLPLVETALGTALGRYLGENALLPDLVLAAPLQRTMQTARLAIEAMEIDLTPQPDHRLIELDYGPDEGMPEAAVVARIGEEALERWNHEAVPPPGWRIDTNQIVAMWKNLGGEAEAKLPGKTLLIVTSNGILRFAPHLCGDFDQFAATHGLKVSTGGLCILEKDPCERHWTIAQWGLKPKLLVSS